MADEDEILKFLDFQPEEDEDEQDDIETTYVIQHIDDHVADFAKAPKSILLVSYHDYEEVYEHICHDPKYLYYAIDIVKSLFINDGAIFIISVYV